jgi:AcrR family transcriptional regulator
VDKGVQTRDRILERAFRLASRDGIEGLTLGTLATDLGMSKSGLFAHFASKEHLQLEVLRVATQRFEEKVVRPSVELPRGLARLDRFFRLWLDWLRDPESSGCIFVVAATESDDQESEVGRYLAERHQLLLQTLGRLVRAAVQERQLRAGVDTSQIAFEIHGIVLAAHFARRLLRDPDATNRALRAYERLLLDAGREAS